MTILSFELCKKLKDAGYPQVVQWGDVYYQSRTKVEEWNDEALWDLDKFPKKDRCRIPTLSELIDISMAGYVVRPIHKE